MIKRKNGEYMLTSIKPRYAQQILNGTKTVEFRKRGPAKTVQVMVIYESAPTKMIVGAAVVGRVITGISQSLWEQYHSVGGISREEFDAYFGSAKLEPCRYGETPREMVRYGTAIELHETLQLKKSIPLEDITGWTRPPQSFLYLNTMEKNKLKAHSEFSAWLTSLTFPFVS